MEEGQTQPGYSWERVSHRLWEAVREDADGNLLTGQPTSRARAALPSAGGSCRRGLIRYLVLAVDCSASCSDRDFRPSRLEACKAAAGQFCLDFFDQNPISQLSLELTRDGGAERLTHLSSNVKHHVNKLYGVSRVGGFASLQNVIRAAMVTLKHVPDYGRRELLVLFSSLSTCDPDDIFGTAAEASKMRLRISVICLAAEVFICRRLTELTDGVFAVARDNAHLAELLRQHAVPLPDTTNSGQDSTDFLYVGFPRHVRDGFKTLAFDGSGLTFSAAAFVCPRCSARATHLPGQCGVCGLQLSSSAHIARSHHHVFPAPPFEERTLEDVGSSSDPEKRCAACLSPLVGAAVQCSRCGHLFCLDCDLFIHEALHNCPCCS